MQERKHYRESLPYYWGDVADKIITTWRPFMEKRQIELTVEQAKELYAKDNSYRTTLLSAFTDGELGIDKRPKRWEDLKAISGVIFNSTSALSLENHRGATKANRCVTTEVRANKYRAECQLVQLAIVLNDGETEEDWVDWTDKGRKWTIYLGSLEGVLVRYRDLSVDWNSSHDHISPSFKRKEDAEFSLKHHRSLWLQYYGMEE